MEVGHQGRGVQLAGRHHEVKKKSKKTTVLSKEETITALVILGMDKGRTVMLCRYTTHEIRTGDGNKCLAL